MHTLDELKQRLDYDPETGIFTWKAGGRKRKGGTVAGTDSDGYLDIYLEYQKYAAHRLAWLFTTGEWPKQFIDHINGDRADNRIINLRDVSHAENLQGARRLSPRSKTGYTGVSWNSKIQCYTAARMKNGKSKFLGCFDTAEEAYAAYLNADSIAETGEQYRPRRASLRKPVKLDDLPEKLRKKLENT